MDLTRLPPRAMVLAALAAGLLFQILLGTSYVAASLDPVGASTGLPIGVVVEDEGPRGREFIEALRAGPSPVAWVEMTDRDALFADLVEKRAFGGLVLPRNFTASLESIGTDAPRAAWVETIANPGASTSGNLVAQRAVDLALDGLRAEVRERAIEALQPNGFGVLLLSEAQARVLAEPLAVAGSTVNAVPQKGSNGLAPTYLAMACWLGGYLGSAALERFRPWSGLASWRRGLVVAGGALVNGAAAAAIVIASGLAAPDPVALALVLAIGAWMSYAVVSLLMDLFGLAGVVPAFAVLALGLPAGGAIYPVQMLPQFFRALHDVSPFTWLVEALRTTLYAPAAGDLPGHLAALALLALGATLLSMGVERGRARRAARPAARAEGEAGPID